MAVKGFVSHSTSIRQVAVFEFNHLSHLTDIVSQVGGFVNPQFSHQTQQNEHCKADPVQDEPQKKRWNNNNHHYRHLRSQ